MKRIIALPIALAVILAGAWIGIRVMRAAPAANDSGLLATVPAPCPTQNDLAGIEGYAPGAGGAERTGQSEGGLFGQMTGDQAGASPAPAKPPAALNCRELSPEVDDYFAGVARAAEDLPSSDYDPGGLAQQIGTDPNALYAYVRDTIRTEPYAGTMRGPYGTLLSRGGSPADKAFLLAQLLQSQGVTVQFVHAPLSDAEIAQVLAAAQAPLPSPPPSTPQPDASPVPASFANDLSAAIDAQYADELAKAQNATGTLLSQSGVSLANDDSAARATLAAALRDHWWLQAQINGNWVDFDPTLPGAAPGTHAGGKPSDDPVDTLPDSLKTMLAFRLSAAYDDGHSADLASQTASTIDLYDQPVKIGFANSGSLAAPEKTAAFTPFIEIGANRSDAGEFSPDPQSGPKITTVVLQIDVTPAGGKAYGFHRTLFNRAAGDQAAYALQSVYFGLVVPGEVGNAVALRQEAAGLEALHNALTYFASAQYPLGVPPGAELTYPIPAMRYLEIDRQARRQLERSTGTHFYVDRPQIVFFQHGVAPAAGGARLVQSLDVFDNRMSAISTQGAQAIRANVTRGYTDDDIENGIVRAFAGTGTLTTARLLAQSQDGVRALRASDAQALAVSADIRANVMDSIGSGVALAPAHPVNIDGEQHYGWWALDPGTGNMIGRMESGAGQSMVEYGKQMAKNIKAEITNVKFLGTMEACVWTAQSNQLAGEDARKAIAEEHQCAAEAACSYYSGILLGWVNGEITPSEVRNAYKIYTKILQLAHVDVPSATGAACKSASQFF